jgi:hypothetical protein
MKLFPLLMKAFECCPPTRVVAVGPEVATRQLGLESSLSAFFFGDAHMGGGPVVVTRRLGLKRSLPAIILGHARGSWAGSHLREA